MPKKQKKPTKGLILAIKMKKASILLYQSISSLMAKNYNFDTIRSELSCNRSEIPLFRSEFNHNVPN